MQQRTGFRPGIGAVCPATRRCLRLLLRLRPALLDGYDLRRVATWRSASRCCASILATPNDTIRYSDHFIGEGRALVQMRARRDWKEFSPSSATAPYEERPQPDWLKIKITHTLECVIGGYTDPEGSRQYFGSTRAGLYRQGRTAHSRRPGRQRLHSQNTGFDVESLAQLDTDETPFHGAVSTLRRAHWIKPKLVAQIEFSEWTHITNEGGKKLRAPVFLGLREDKDPKDCTFDQSR